MIKAWVFICALLVLPNTAAGGNDIAFADIPWGSSAATVKARMQERGFAFEKMDSAGDLMFTGLIAGEPATIYALRTSDDRLVKWSIAVRPGDRRTIAYYRELKRALARLYGTPLADIESWTFPYQNGGHIGYEEDAIRVGKGTLRAGWTTGGDLPGVVILVNDRLVVQAQYEGPGWNEEVDKRRTHAW
jgi:hypothetical protein